MHKSPFPIALALLAGLIASPIDAEPAQQAAEIDSAVVASGQFAARVYINPKTGQLTGPPPGVESPGLSTAMQNRLSRSYKGLEKRQLPNGVVLVNLQGRFQNMSVVTLTPEGEAHLSCGHPANQAAHALAHGAYAEESQQEDQP